MFLMSDKKWRRVDKELHVESVFFPEISHIVPIYAPCNDWSYITILARLSLHFGTEPFPSHEMHIFHREIHLFVGYDNPQCAILACEIVIDSVES